LTYTPVGVLFVVMSKNFLKRAIRITGGQSALARGLGVKQGQVWNWLNRDGLVPGGKAIPIEKLTNGEVTRYQLRPDLYPPDEYIDSV